MFATLLRHALLPQLLFVPLLLSLPLKQALAQSAAPPASSSAFSIRSTDFSDGGVVRNTQMYGHAGCTGQNRSPDIRWSHPPAGTTAFAITLLDTDAPGRGWWHWAVANIPASIQSLPSNASASGALAALGAVEARNDFDDDGYSGPCPPVGTVHRYVLTVYALKTPIFRVGSGRPAPFFEHEIADAALAKASIVVKNPVSR